VDDSALHLLLLEKVQEGDLYVRQMERQTYLLKSEKAVPMLSNPRELSESFMTIEK
jgi:hypothetical protein